MLSLLSRWMHNRRRRIFRFYDGRKVRGADPIEVSIGLSEHPTYLPRHLEDARWGDAKSLASVATAACDVFGVKPLEADGKNGMTVSERLELMLAFDLYMLALKKNIGHSPMLRSSTAATSPGSSEPTTSDSLGSGQIESERPSEPLSTPDSESSPLPIRPSSDGA